MVRKPLDDFNACDDFFVLVVKAHILTAAMELLGMTEINEIPSSQIVSDLEDVWMESAEHRRKVIQQISVKVVETFTELQFNSQDAEAEHEVTGPEDGVFSYAKGLLTLGVFTLSHQGGGW